MATNGVNCNTCTGPRPTYPNVEFANKVWQIPVVQTFWQYSSSAYGKIKDSNNLFNWALNTTEQTVQIALEQSIPLLNKLETPIHFADQTLCKGLNKLEATIPQINQTPCQIYEDAKSKVSQTMQPTVQIFTAAKDVGVGKATELKDFSWTKVNEVLSTPYGNMAVNKIDDSATLAEKLLDHYFPAGAGETPEDDAPIPENDKLLHTLKTIGRLSNKVARRVYRAVSSRIGTLKKEDIQEYIAAIIAILQLTYNLRIAGKPQETATTTTTPNTSDDNAQNK